MRARAAASSEAWSRSIDRLSPPRAAALCSKDRRRVSTAEGGRPARYEYGVVITKMAYGPYRLEREPVSVSKRANTL